MVRRTGASFFALTVSWSAAEPAPGKYNLDGHHAHGAAAAPVGRDAAPRPSARDRDGARRAGGPRGRRVRRSEAVAATRAAARRPHAGAARLPERCRSAKPPTSTSRTSPTSCAPTAGSSTAPSQFLAKKAPRLLVGRDDDGADREPRAGGRRGAPPKQPASALHLLSLRQGQALRAARPGRAREGLAAARSRARRDGRSRFRPSAIRRRPRTGRAPARQADFVRALRRFLAKRRRADAALRALRRAARRARPTEVAPGASVAQNAGATPFSRTGACETRAGDAKPAWLEWAKTP